MHAAMEDPCHEVVFTTKNAQHYPQYQLKKISMQAYMT